MTTKSEGVEAPHETASPLPGVRSTGWFDVISAADSALHHLQYPLREMQLPGYPAGGTCGNYNLDLALEKITQAQVALRALRDQLEVWQAMNESYGRARNTPESRLAAYEELLRIAANNAHDSGEEDSFEDRINAALSSSNK